MCNNLLSKNTQRLSPLSRQEADNANNNLHIKKDFQKNKNIFKSLYLIISQIITTCQQAKPNNFCSSVPN
jgi:hypothetical protein